MNLRLLAFALLSIALLFLNSISAYATHLRAGQITVERLSGLTFRIRVEVYTNTINTNVQFGGEDDWLDFGDGTRMLIPMQDNIPRPDLGEGIAYAFYEVTHTYPGIKRYLISYSEPNRNGGVLNMANSINTRFYIESEIVLDPFLGENDSPKLLVPPIDRACTGVAFYHNPGAYDPDGGDSLSYELVIPFRDRATQVVAYRDPNDPSFYNNFGQGNETGTGPPTFTINPIDGTIIWNSPGSNGVGEFNIAFVIREWRKKNGQWYNMGFVRRDMQIIVDDCDNERPDLIVPNDTCVVAGTKLENIKIIGIDPDNDPVKIEAFSEIFNFAPIESPATYSPVPGLNDFRAQPATTLFNWQTQCSHVKQQPYQVVFKITDKSPTGSKLVTFKTWQITVVGPEPEWDGGATRNVGNRSVTLDWESYTCQNAVTMQVWRKVDNLDFEPNNCQTGMPPSLGYTLIAQLPIGETTYTDTNNGEGLAVGTVFCYRLVAIFPEPGRGESYVSDEVCIEPFEMDEPMITGVSVDSTHNLEGIIDVKWIKPFDLTGYTTLRYDLYRAEGFEGNANIVKVATVTSLADTLRVKDEGLNTTDLVYNYRVVMYIDGAAVASDTSETASSVRLEAQSELKKIVLNWFALVPWSNVSGYQHQLFRGDEGSDYEDMIKIADLDPAAGFTYTDEDDNGAPLNENKTYCYYVLTKGGYGNDDIIEPLVNRSQIVCAQPSDSIPPCKPVLTVELTNCEEFLASQPCNVDIFKNTLKWDRPADTCSTDVLGYKVYRAAEKDGIYTWLENAGLKGIVRDTFYVDNGVDNTGLSTLAYCYRISAVDRSGNESELSEPICNDNCPYYELPNVFTPNGDDCNARFSAYSDNTRYTVGFGENGEPVLACGGVSDVSKCARFVQKVRLKIYNRWGKEVYSYVSGGERTIYVDWDGRANDGSDLATGIYYYIAEVTFDSVDPEKRNQQIKGWVHLVR